MTGREWWNGALDQLLYIFTVRLHLKEKNSTYTMDTNNKTLLRA